MKPRINYRCTKCGHRIASWAKESRSGLCKGKMVRV